MTPREHARLAKLLIRECGGLEEASKACRVGMTSLSNYQNVHMGDFMPADVMSDLEAYCGRPWYSRALFEARPEICEARDLVAEVCEAAESATNLQRVVRLATADGKLTPAERDRLAKAHADATKELRDVGALINRGEAS